MDTASPISRLIAFFVAPILTAVTPVIVNFAQDAAGIDLNGDQLKVLLTAVVVGQLAVVYKWLDGRAKYEASNQ